MCSSSPPCQRSRKDIPLRVRIPRPCPDETLQSPRREVIKLLSGNNLSETCGIPLERKRTHVEVERLPRRLNGDGDIPKRLILPNGKI